MEPVKPPPHDQLEFYIDQASATAAVRTAVIHPVDRNSLLGTVEAAASNLIKPLLVGPEKRIRAVARTEGIDLGDIPLINTAHSHESAEVAVDLARRHEVEILMKGGISSSEMLSAIVQRKRGIRTERRISHVFMLDVPNYHKPLIITDAAINITPDLSAKRDIVQNAIDFARALGISTPKVAVLAAVEKVTPGMRSTIDAAALCKMADRGQISAGLIDGPLAFDNAISLEAARDKHISSPVSGDADILLAPDMEAANMIAKQLMYLAGARSAGLVLGARVPVVLTSRAEKTLGRLASCALASLLAEQAAFKEADE